MSESDSIRFPRLNDTNYAEWSMRMEAIFVRKELWSVVNVEVDTEGKDEEMIEKELNVKTSKRSASKMAEVWAEMILRVEDGQLSHMHERDPMEIWQTLQRVHRAAGFATSLALRRKFLTMKKMSSQPMQAWIGTVKALAFRMEAAGIDVSEQDTILALTMGLPSTYDAVIINFDATPTEQLTLDHVIGRLLNEETRQASSTGTIKPKKEEPSDETLAVTAGRHSRGEATCFFCERPGHFKAECPEKREWERIKAEKEKRTHGMAGAVYLDSDNDESLSGFH
jgi:hypothetical protein